MFLLFLPFIIFVTCVNQCDSQSPKPHIIIIVADDLGWNDVGFHGSKQIPTPNIDALANAGVILNNYYVQPICTPSRSALLSGYHPIHTGLQHDTIIAAEPYGLPLDLKLLPEHLKSLGYKTKHIGKWHLGFFKKDYTPTYRGFDSHYGYWSGRIDYYDHTACDNNYWGYDFQRNMTADRDAYGHYATDLFTEEATSLIHSHNTTSPMFMYLAHLAVHSGNPYDPLQAPAEVIEKFSYIKDEQRRKFAAMLWKLDDSIGKVIEALMQKDMLSNSIIVFTSDNGGPAAGFNYNAASNWPLRGVKAGLWEGGVRGAALVWSPLIQNPGRVSKQMIQVTDWLPTLFSAAGGRVDDLPIMDGVDVWKSIVDDTPSPRSMILHNIDPIVGGAAIRYGSWKLLFKPSGYGPDWDKWFGPSGRPRSENASSSFVSKKKLMKRSPAAKAILTVMPRAFKRYHAIQKDAEVLCGPIPDNATQSCGDEEEPCLFHIDSDPCEYFDVSKKFPFKVKLLMNLIREFNSTAVPIANQEKDPNANPVFWDYTWTNWQDYASPSHSLSIYPYHAKLSAMELKIKKQLLMDHNSF